MAGKSEVSAEEIRAKAAEKKAQEEAEGNSDPKGSATTAKGEAEAAATSKAKAAEEGAITAATSKVKTEEEARKAEVKTETERAEAAEALKIPLSQKGKASGVAELNSEGKLPEGELPSSVVTSSTAVLNAKNFITSGNIVNFPALIKAMEEEGKIAVIPQNVVMSGQALLNKEHCASPTTFQYRFVGLGPDRPTVQLPVMAAGQYAFRCNQNAEGEKVNSNLYKHPDIIFEHLAFIGSGSADGGSVASSYRRSFWVMDVTCEGLANGFKEEQSTDRSYVNGLHGDHTVTGWLFQTEEGDGKIIMNLQPYGCKGLKAIHGSGVAIGLVSGEHSFTASSWDIRKAKLEGDGPNEAGGKAQGPLLSFNGGVYKVSDSRLYTLTNPNRPAFEVNDSGAAERWTDLTFDKTRFLQRLNDPANPTGESEPCGNLQGVAGNLVGLSTQTTIKFIDTFGEMLPADRRIVAVRYTLAHRAQVHGARTGSAAGAAGKPSRDDPRLELRAALQRLNERVGSAPIWRQRRHHHHAPLRHAVPVARQVRQRERTSKSRPYD